jgi:hypothetical protein
VAETRSPVRPNGPSISGPRGPTSPTGEAAPHASQDPPRALTDSLTLGILVRHGRAPLEFKSEAALSYFVTLDTPRGERTLWSRGLERALIESRTQPKPGDAIGVRENGIDPLTVTVRVRDREGRVVTQKQTETPRGHWIVEKREFFDERAAAAAALRDPRVSRRAAVRDHPDLLGAYWALDSAGKVATSRIANPESRSRFVALVREALAHTVERGEPLPQAGKELHDRASRSEVERTQTR